MAEVLGWIREVLSRSADYLWAVFALLLDFLGELSPTGTGLLVLGVGGFYVLGAVLMQRLLVRRLSAHPDQPVRFRELEAWFFLPAWPILPFVLLWRGLKALWRLLTGWFRRFGKKKDAGEDGKPAVKAPFLAASLGPSFLVAGLVVAILYLLARLAEPLLGAHLELAPGASAWEHLVLGNRPEMGLWLPLGRTAPYLSGLLLFLFFSLTWWWVARAIRLFHWRHLGRNLLLDRDRPDVLASWRDWAAVRHLVRPASPYRMWAGTLVVAAVPLAGWGWLTLSDVPYRVGAGDLAVALVVLMGWGVHLVLAGAERQPVETEGEEGSILADAAGWPEVRDDLVERLQIEVPPPFLPSRTVPEPRWAPGALARDPLLSPLLEELVPERDGHRRLTRMQRHELHRLARLGHVFTRPEPARGELSLGRPGEEEFEVRERNRILFAPEGAGKTTLALLAAANHALVHTRATLLVVRDDASAEALYDRIHDLLDPSTLRWTLRLRRVGSDLVNDFSRGIVPDLVITSLEDLTVEMLHQMDTYAPLLHRLGLIVVDDVESFAGNVETHAQLAFRRLTLAARKILGVDELGERGSELAPLVLALGCVSMHRTATWIEALLGVNAEVVHHRPSEEDSGSHGGDTDDAQVQELYRLSDFHAATGERLDPVELVESCERLAVPWHYRFCADGQRHLGRSALVPRDEPEHFTADPRRAAVLLLQGAWSEVRRELDRLALAGGLHPRRPCAVLTMVDPDEDMALTQLDHRLSLATDLATLPRPVLRPPSGRTVGSHLASDLTQSWTEVEDVLETFGNATAHKLRELAAESLLLTERRVDVHEQRDDYLEKVYVRALSGAVAGEHDPPHRTPLPPRVAQVELATERSVQVLDRTDLDPLLRVDADSSGLAYYPGRVFTHEGRRYVVVHHAAAEGGDGQPGEKRRERVPEGSILVEPMLGDDVSSPRRRVRLEAILATGESGRRIEARLRGTGGVPRLEPSAEGASVTGYAFHGPDPLRIGDHSIEVELALVRLRARHFSTYLLGPTFCEVRQRRLLGRDTRGTETGDGDSGAGSASGGPHHDAPGWETRLDTVALCLYPNPGGGPILRLREARLVAAAMRAVLPSMYRGARDGLGVALHLHEDDPPPEHELGDGEGFVLFDLHNLGNGTARAIHRDGVELLLRLTRLHLERVLYHDRLLALHDHWSDESGDSELYADLADRREDRSPNQRQQDRRKAESAAREAALNWLDSRLRPEGDAAAFSGALGRHAGFREAGEGDVIDIGRCWYSSRQSVADLVWVKHRWRLPNGDEAVLDVGFERRLADRARDLKEDDPLLAPGLDLHRQHLADPDYQQEDGSVWGAPREVWRVEGEEPKPASSQPGQGDEALASLHARLAAQAAHDWPHLGPLARKLYERRTAIRKEVDSAEPTSWEPRYRLARYLASFVQGIPTRRTTDDGPPALRPAVRTLLERQGQVHEKSLLLALLLEACGIPAGLMVSFQEGRSLVAAALPDPVDAKNLTTVHYRDEEGRFAREEESTGKAEHFARGKAAAEVMYGKIKAWSQQVGLPEAPRFWSVQRVRERREPGAGESHGRSDDGMANLYVPIEVATVRDPGDARQGKPDTWVFLPLVTVLHHLHLHAMDAPDPDAPEPAPPAPEPSTGPAGDAAPDGVPEAPSGDEPTTGPDDEEIP